MGSKQFVLERLEPNHVPESALVDLQSLMSAQAREARPLDPPLPVEVFAAAVRNFPAFIEAALFLARTIEGEPAGFALLSHRRTNENSHLAEMQMWAKPEMRRRGLAADLLEAVVQEAEAKDFQILESITTEGVGWGDALCRAVGAQPTQERRTWRLPVEGLDRDQIRMMASQAADRARGYELVDVESPLPDEIVEEAVELLQFLHDDPAGTSAGDGRRITVESMRQLETAWSAMGTSRRWQFARHEESGSLAGVLDAVWNPSVSTNVSQDQAVVRPEFRGRSLGMWMKACMIDKVLEAWPEATEIRTTTVFPNPAMDSVDERLGFIPYLKTTVWHGSVAAVREWLEKQHLGKGR